MRTLRSDPCAGTRRLYRRGRAASTSDVWLEPLADAGPAAETAVAVGALDDRKRAVRAGRGVHGAEDAADDETSARADGQIAHPVPVVLQQRHACADGAAGDAAIERVLRDDAEGVAVRLHLDDVGVQAPVVLVVVERERLQR